MKKPRTCTYMGMNSTPTIGENDTWLESEAFCYPNGKMARGCRAVNVLTGKLVIVRCGIPDTYFSIPSINGGYITCEDGTYEYHPKGD